MAARKRISANAVHALKEALTAAFWFKKDLYNYAKAAVAGEPTFLAGIDWRDRVTLKRDSVSSFVDRLVREQDEHQDLLLVLLVDVANMTDFPQLARVEDAPVKIKAAKEAVAHLKSLVRPYEQALAEQEAAREKIAAAPVEAVDRRATKLRLAELEERYIEIVQMAAAGSRVRARAVSARVIRCVRSRSEGVLQDQRRAARRRLHAGQRALHHRGEVGGLAGRSCQRSMCSPQKSTVGRKTSSGCSLRSPALGTPRLKLTPRRGQLVLMDGADLYAVLDDRIDLRELLRRKRRHAAMTGDIRLPAAKFLGEH